MKCFVAHLQPEFAQQRHLFSHESLSAATAGIVASYGQMRSLVDDQNNAKEADFQPAENERACRFCNFRELCDWRPH